MEEEDDGDVVKSALGALKAYLHSNLPLDKDFFIKLGSQDLLASNTARELAQLAGEAKKDCVWNLVTYMEEFYTEGALLRLCDFLEEYAQQAKPRLATIASRIRQEILKHKPQLPPSVPEDTLQDHRSARVHDDKEVLYPVITPLKEEFSQLVSEVFFEIEQLNKEKMGKLHTYLSTLLEKSSVPETVDKLKKYLGVWWNELNPDLLRSIVKHLENDKLSKMMTNFQRTLAKKGSKPIGEFPVETVQLEVASEETSLLVEMDRSPDQLTLEDVFSLRNLINSLGRGIRAIFRGFKRGCTILYFSIPTECAWSLPSCLLPSNLSLLEEWKVLFFSVKGAFTIDIKERRVVDSLDKHSLLSSLSEYKTRNDDLQTRNDDLQTRVQQMEKGLSFKEKELRVMEKEVKPYVVVSETQRQPQPGDDKMSVLGLSRVKRSPPTWDKNPPSKRPKSNIDLASRPSEVDLRNISYITGKDLLRSLKIAEPKIDELVSNNPNDIAEAYFQGLMFWKNENALLPVTWSTLVEALKKAKLTKLANELPPKENKPKVTPPVREDTLHRSAGVHDEPLEMDTEGGNGNAPSRPPGAGTERGHQTAKADAPIAKNPKHTDFKVVTVVESISDFLPYLTDMTAHLSVLGAALGLFESSKAIIDGHGTPEEKCLHIISHWLKSTPRPTWACLCQKLRLVSCFNAVVHRIATDHNLSTADMDGRELSGISSGEDLASRPSAVDLRNISRETGRKWKELLRSLEIEEARIATYVMDNPNNSAEACYQGLMFWENENALLPVTWGTLKAALKKAQLTKLANKLPPKENKPQLTQSEPEDTPLHHSARVHDVPIASSVDFLPFLDNFLPNLVLLSVVLGIESQAADILKAAYQIVW